MVVVLASLDCGTVKRPKRRDPAAPRQQFSGEQVFVTARSDNKVSSQLENLRSLWESQLALDSFRSLYGWGHRSAVSLPGNISPSKFTHLSHGRHRLVT